MARKDYDDDYREPEWHHPQGSGYEQPRDPYWHNIMGAEERKKRKVELKFSTTEIQQLAVATLVITLVFGIGFSPYTIFNLAGSDVNYGSLAFNLVVALIAVGSAFIIHELGHKFVAQHYGCWAEFRYKLIFLLGSAFLALMLNFFIIIPGAVYIRGHLTKKQNGIVSAAGPLTNIIIAVIFGGVMSIGLFTNYYIFRVGFLGAFINCFIGAFNMIPIGNLDGGKILKWNPLIWIVMAVLLGGPVVIVFFAMF
jgi:Zn-dependent protease